MNWSMIISQVIVLIVILALFYFVFKFDKTKITIKDMTIVTILCVLTAVLNRTLALRFPPGQPIFMIGFGLCMAIIIGVLFSPRLALIAGLITDFLQVLLGAAADGSIPFLGFTLSAMMSCLIPSLMVIVTKKRGSKLVNLLIIAILIVANVAAAFYLFSTDSISIDKTENQLTNSLRWTIIGALAIISIMVVVINYFVERKFDSKDSKIYLSTAHISLIVLLVEIVSSIILTSLWIQIMYGIPFIVGASTRIIRTVLSLPINIIVIFIVLKYIPDQFKTSLLKEKKSVVKPALEDNKTS